MQWLGFLTIIRKVLIGVMNIKRSYYGFGVNITSFYFKEAEFLNQEKCNTKP